MGHTFLQVKNCNNNIILNKRILLLTINYIFKYFFIKLNLISMEIFGYPIIYNANNVNEDSLKNRALLVYLVKPFQLKQNDAKFSIHQNLKQCKQIVKVIGEFGYIVDVADVRSNKIISLKKYDIIISHNFKLDETGIELKNGAIRVYLSSGMNHITNNEKVRERYELLKNRRNCNLKVRNINDENMSFVDKANYIVGFGNNYIGKTWKTNFNIPTYSFNNYGFNDINYIHKNHSLTRKSFLYFASSNQVGKGLDLLMEIFPKYPDLHLYVCSSFQDELDFCMCYYKELYKTSNIHAIGWVKIYSKEFIEVCQKCSYVILPTCSEGQVGSVVQCMYAGLIPIVTMEAGIDTEDFGVTISSNRLVEIEDKILELSKKSPAWHVDRSLKTRDKAKEKYSEEAFLNRWREIISEIINNRFEQHDWF